MKKKILTLTIMVLVLNSGFSQSSGDELSFNRICSELQMMTQQIELMNSTEFPNETIQEINQELTESSELTESLSAFNGMVLNLELINNESVCFNGSLLFNNSQVEYIKIIQHESAGESKKNVLIHIETTRIEGIINDFKQIQQSEDTSPFSMIGKFFRITTSLISYVLSDEFSIKPLSSLTIIFDIIKVVMEMMTSSNVTPQ